MRLKGKPSVDRLIIGNVFDLNEKFDLVTSFASLDWFSTPQIMPKVASLLNDGGFFYAWVTNWWHNISTTNVFGHFPFAPNRMTNEEFQNYLQTNMPAHEDNIIKSLSYFDPTHPTLGDYIQEALKVGLVPLAWRENVLPNTLAMHGGVTSLGIAELDRQELFRAVGDIQTQRPDVRVSDLFSYSRAILFRKAPPSDGLTLSHLEALRREQDFHYRPDNILARGIKTAAERIFAPSKR
jgi:hypothetical protein